jgi:DNA-binding transcriptional LysR family regulator
MVSGCGSRSRWRRRHLLEDPFELAVPEGHPLAGRATVALEELAGQIWIGGAPDSAYGAIVVHSCRAAGFEPRFAFGSDDYNAVRPCRRRPGDRRPPAPRPMLGVLKETADAFTAAPM